MFIHFQDKMQRLLIRKTISYYCGDDTNVRIEETLIKLPFLGETNFKTRNIFSMNLFLKSHFVTVLTLCYFQVNEFRVRNPR